MMSVAMPSLRVEWPGEEDSWWRLAQGRAGSASSEPELRGCDLFFSIQVTVARSVGLEERQGQVLGKGTLRT